MSQPLLLKCYGHLYPVQEQEARLLSRVCGSASPADNQIVFLENDLLRISFEGIWFPEEEVLNCIRQNMRPEQKGKLDVLDLENWILRRYAIESGSIAESCAPLNNVLDFSGF